MKNFLCLWFSISLACAAAVASTPAWKFETIAGRAAGSDDGIGAAAQFRQPSGAAYDAAGNLYIADTENYTIRKITPAGVVTTLAGRPGVPGTDDGPGSVARFTSPTGVAVNSAGEVFVTDYFSSTIRKITPAGDVTTVAGAADVWDHADGQGTAARFTMPAGLAIDAEDNLYIADAAAIRRMSPSGLVTTIAGSSEAWDTGSDDGAAADARFNFPQGLSLAPDGSIYVADTLNETIRRISPEGEVTTVAGAVDEAGSVGGLSSAARFRRPAAVAVTTSGDVLIADFGNHALRKLTAAGEVSTVAGQVGSPGAVDGQGGAARLRQPTALARAADGSFVVVEMANNQIRRFAPDGAVTTIAGSSSIGSVDGTGSAARFHEPVSVAADYWGNLYVADAAAHVVRKVTRAGVVTTLAGVAGEPGDANGKGASARFRSPQSVATDLAGNVFVADTGNHQVRKVSPAGVVSTLAGQGKSGEADGVGLQAAFDSPTAVAVDLEGNVFVADSGNRLVRRIAPNGTVTRWAGQPGVDGAQDGSADEATFGEMYGLAVDGAGNVFVAEDAVLRKISPERTVSTVAGGMELLWSPHQLSIDAAGDIYATSWSTHTIVRVTAGGQAELVGGAEYAMGTADGVGEAARFSGPASAVIDGQGYLWVADTFNHTIRRGTPVASTTLHGEPQGVMDRSHSVAQKFRVTKPSAVSEITLRLTRQGAGGSLVLDLRNDVSGRPGATLARFAQVTVVADTQTADVVFTPEDAVPVLEPGAYWVVLPSSAAADEEWQWWYLSELSTGTGTGWVVDNATLAPGASDDLWQVYKGWPMMMTVVTPAPVEDAPVVLKTSAAPALIAGSTAEFSVVAGGATAIVWQVSEDGTEWENLADGGRYSGTNTASLTVTGVTLGMSGWKYRAVLFSTGGSVLSESMALSVSPPNTAPTLSSIVDQTLDEDKSKTISFTVEDAEQSASALSVTRTSSNPTLLPVSGLVLGGTGANRTLKISPAKNLSGTSTVELTVNDGQATTTRSFNVTVRSVNDAPTISAIASLTVNEDTASKAIAFTIGDAETSTSKLKLTSSSSNTKLVPTAGIVLGGTGSKRTVTIKPAKNQSGKATIKITVSDGALTATESFTVTVKAVNDAPTISAIASQTIKEDKSTKVIPFTIGDAETSTSKLKLTRTSSNTKLIPTSKIVLGGSGSKRTVVVTPAKNQSGTATIKITVSDGTLTATESFKVTVTAVNDAPTITKIADQVVARNGRTSALKFTIGDAETSASKLKLTRTSSNTTLLPTSRVVFGGSGANRTVTMTPASNRTGTVVIKLTVSDGKLSTSTSFTVRVGTTAARADSAKATSSQAPQAVTKDTFAKVGDAVSLVVRPPENTSLLQWFRDDEPIAGATGATFKLPSVKLTDAGGYDAVALGRDNGQASATIELTVVESTAIARPTGAGIVLLTQTLRLAGAAEKFTQEMLLPAGWTVVSSGGADATLYPRVGDTGVLVWQWKQAPRQQVVLTTVLRAPAGVVLPGKLEGLLRVEQPDGARRLLLEIPVTR